MVLEGTLRCGACARSEVLDSLGGDTDALISEVGLTRSYFDDPENTVTLLGLGHLLRRSVETTGCDHLGVLVGRPIMLSSIGAIGLLMQASPTVAHALQVMDHSRSSIVAGRIGLSVRTLNRRLLGAGTSLQAIRDDVCAEAARQLLRNTEKPASDVALILGYSDSSAFTRAFRRWHGVPPAEWRARRRELG